MQGIGPDSAISEPKPVIAGGDQPGGSHGRVDVPSDACLVLAGCAVAGNLLELLRHVHARRLVGCVDRHCE